MSTKTTPHSLPTGLPTAATMTTPANKKSKNGPKSKDTLSIRAPMTKWDKEDLDSMVQHLLQAKIDGNTSENEFKSTVWGAIAASFPDPRKIEARVCESKWSRMKADYKQVKFLRECSGFGWDNENFLVTAQPEVWADVKTV